MTRVVVISDTHGAHREMKHKIPGGDILIHCGDCLWTGKFQHELNNFLSWFKNQKAKHLVLIAGNHDWFFQKEPRLAKQVCKDAGVHYLENSYVELEGLKIYGTPIQPFFCDWAFNIRSPLERSKYFSKIPAGTDILVTHCPPAYILDIPGGQKGNVGCGVLRQHIQRVRPKLSLFGHIHGSYGQHVEEGTHFVNASTCDETYDPVNPPIVIDI